ncbi:hypothetical protein OIU34_00745 [Pararhizobium sp. BT-229]|uniref:hypothetical protein n=1 Tax=Pararhizobium sp. BT-229 TaxID=2986923 RepID=UPI0021F6ADAC|nr:hypothetical protein [Pararhizobium sp. BT-229]MCV9960413.1 hypothetical protein [Pararhizobium sp. BT-229]
MTRYTDERGDPVSTADTEKSVEVSGVEARQGLLGRPVLFVLLAGLALAVVAWAGAEIFGESTDNDAATQVQENAPIAKETPPSGQGTMDNTPATGDPAQTAPADKDPTPQTGSGG